MTASAEIPSGHLTPVCHTPGSIRSVVIQQLGEDKTRARNVAPRVHVQSGDLICGLYWNQPDVKFECGITTDLQDTLGKFASQHEAKLRGKHVEYFVMVRPTSQVKL